MKIAIFTDTYTPEINGVAQTLNRLTQYLTVNNIEHMVFAPESNSPYPSTPHVQRFASLPFMLYPECRISIPNPVSIKHALDSFQPTLIHIATPFSMGLMGLHYGKSNQIPMVASYHTHFDDYLAYYNLQFLQKWIWNYMTWFHRRCEKVYVPSQSTKEKLIAQSVHDHIEIWGRGIDTTMFTPNKKSEKIRHKYRISEKKILLYVGRLAPEKDINIVFNTFHSLPDRLKNDTHLLVVGDGPLYKPLTKDKLPQVTFTGFIEGPELADIYAASDVFLFPSSTETFGNVVLEAMASGLPVIGANAGGVANIITHGTNGYLCHPRNDASFIEHTIRLLENDYVYFSLSTNARRYALSQSWDGIFQRLISSYSELVKKDIKIRSA